MTRRTKFLGAIALLLAGAVMWPVATHYRVKGRLAAYRSQLKASGEKLTAAELTPPYSAEGSAGAGALLAAAGQLRVAGSSLTNPPTPMRTVAPGHALVCWQQKRLATSESDNVWPGLSVVIRGNQSLLNEVHTALKSPKLAFNIDYTQGFNLTLTHLDLLKGASQWLSAETCLALHEGRSADACESLQTLTALVERYQGEPLMISALVRVAIGSIAMSDMWEALQSPEFQDAQWLELQRTWASVDALSQMEWALAMERALSEKAFAEGRESYAAISSAGLFGGGVSGSSLAELAQLGKDVLDNPKKGLVNFAHRYPGYWEWKCWQSYDDELANAQTVQAGIEAIRMAREQRALGPAMAGFERASEQIQQAHPRAGVWLGYSLARGGGIHNFLLRAERFETQRSLLVGAIALKRYHLKHGSYPAQLSGLAPEFVPELPCDPIDGKPLRYRLNRDGSYLLYSVGEDGVDNGGDPRPTQGMPNSRLWLQARDVVWPSPASSVEVKAYFDQLDAQRERQGPLAVSADEAFRRRYGLRPHANAATNAVK